MAYLGTFRGRAFYTINISNTGWFGDYVASHGLRTREPVIMFNELDLDSQLKWQVFFEEMKWKQL